MKQAGPFVLFFTMLLFCSCKNDLKLNAPYKEVPSIYAVLSAQEKAHIIRVNKIFLGEGNANVMAQVADSINYPEGELTITLDRYISGEQVDAAPITKKRSIVFKDSLIQAGPGAFNSTQRVYVSYDDLHEGPVLLNTAGNNINAKWKVSGDYVLTVKNNRTGNVFKAKSTIVDSITPSGIRPLTPPYYPYNQGTDPIEYIDYSELEKQYAVRFNPVNNAHIYQTVIRMHFYDSLHPWNIYRYVDYVGNNIDASRDKKVNALGQSFFSSDFKGKDIFYATGIGLSKQGLTNEIFGRKMYMIEYHVYASTQDYADYIEFVKPSLNIAQNKPLYSNFENRNALGIFTFRSRHAVKKMIQNFFINEFSYNTNTCKYLFFNADFTRKGCRN